MKAVAGSGNRSLSSWSSDLRASDTRSAHLLRLRDTTLCMPVAADVGKRLHDKTGRLIGQVTDFLIEERTVEEAVEAGDRSSSWAARPVYALVRLHHRLAWPARFVYVPATSVSRADDHLMMATHVESVTRALTRHGIL